MTGPVEGGGVKPTIVDFQITSSPSETDKTAAPASPASTSLPEAESTSSSGAILRAREGVQAPDTAASLPRTGDGGDSAIGEGAALTLSVTRSETPSLPKGCEDVTDPNKEDISIKVTGPDGKTVTVSVEKNPGGNDPKQTRSDHFLKGLKDAFKIQARPEEQYLEELGILNDLLDKMHQKIMEYMTPRYPIS